MQISEEVRQTSMFKQISNEFWEFDLWIELNWNPLEKDKAYYS
jgi:hypothetical protein